MALFRLLIPVKPVLLNHEIQAQNMPSPSYLETRWIWRCLSDCNLENIVLLWSTEAYDISLLLIWNLCSSTKAKSSCMWVYSFCSADLLCICFSFMPFLCQSEPAAHTFALNSLKAQRKSQPKLSNLGCIFIKLHPSMECSSWEYYKTSHGVQSSLLKTQCLLE